MKVTVLQWNILFSEEIKNIAEFLKEVRPDIICLQELSINRPSQSSKHTPEFIAKELGYNFHYHEITFPKDFSLANGIFTRFEIDSKRSAPINNPTGTDNYDDEYRAYVETTLKIDDKQLTVGTVHMSYTHAFEITPRKLLETNNLIKLIKPNNKNFVLTDDFNAQPDSEVIKNVGQNLKNAGPDYDEKTWTTKPFSYNGFEANTLDWRLDYVFTSPDVKVLSSEILKTDFSDHLPILATIEI